MQLSTALKIQNLLKGTYLLKKDRRPYTITIRETTEYTIDIDAVDRSKAAEVALGLMKLGLVKPKGEVRREVLANTRASFPTAKQVIASNQLSRERVRESMSRFTGDNDLRMNMSRFSGSLLDTSDGIPDLESLSYREISEMVRRFYRA